MKQRFATKSKMRGEIMRQSRLRLFAASLASLGASVALAQSSQVTASAEGTTSAPVAAVSQTPANRPTIDLLFWPTVSMDGKDKTMTYNYVGTSYQFSNKMKLF